jgi:hypothetical protein
MTSEQWLADIGKAADELGFHIESIPSFRQIRLVPMYGKVEITIEIDSVILGGDALRALLRKQEKPEPRP